MARSNGDYRDWIRLAVVKRVGDLKTNPLQLSQSCSYLSDDAIRDFLSGRSALRSDKLASLLRAVGLTLAPESNS